MTDTIRGELLMFRVRSADHWGTGTLRTLHDGGEVAITGKVLGANEGDTVELDGAFEVTKYGRQFKIRSCRVVLPCDTAGVVGWLAAKLPQISRRRAEALVERFGVDGLWALLDAGAVGALCVVDGITLPRADEIVAAYQLHKQDRDRIVRFKQWGLTDNQIARVVDEWGEEAEERILRDPYALIECVKGFGWQRADAVAQRMGVRRDDPSRLAAGLLHAMDTATQSGHCYCPAGKLVALAAQKICSVTDESAVRRALEQLVERGKVDRIGQNIYLPRIAKAEGQLAKTFAARVRQSGKGRAA